MDPVIHPVPWQALPCGNGRGGAVLPVFILLAGWDSRRIWIPGTIETKVCQQDADGRAGGNPGYTAAAHPAIYFASSTYF